MITVKPEASLLGCFGATSRAIELYTLGFSSPGKPTLSFNYGTQERYVFRAHRKVKI
jgi:hypothetical protein